MARSLRSRSPFALFCLALRTSRGLSQEELSAASGAHVSTIKNAEGDRHISVGTLGVIYRAGFATAGKALTSLEWHQLLAYWFLREFPGDVQPDEFAEALRAVRGKNESALSAHIHAVGEAMTSMNPDDCATFAALAAAATGPHAAAILSAARALVTLAEQASPRGE